MRHTFYILILILLATSCKDRKLKRAFQGDWYAEGFDTPAFTVRGDSMYFPGIEGRGYHYDFRQDTLEIQFTELKRQGLVLSFSSQQMSVLDLSPGQDTVLLSRLPKY